MTPTPKKAPATLRLSVVAPVYNEAEGIRDYITRTLEVLEGFTFPTELVLVNDGSRDASLPLMQATAREHENIVVVDLSRNYGQSIAMTAGLATAKGDMVVLMDSDLQDPPELIPAMVAKLMADDLDVVYAARTGREGETWMKKFTSLWFYRVAAAITGFAIPEDAGDFRIFRRSVVDAILSLPEHNRYMKMLYAYVGFKVGSVPFTRQARHKGTTHYNYPHLFGMAFNAIFAFSFLPLRMVAMASFGLSLLLMIAAVVVFLRKLLGAYAVDGWTSLMLMQSVMFMILFAFLGILSEYIGRMMDETKQRPLYFIRRVYGRNEERP